MLNIPIPANSGSFDQRVDLDGSTFVLSLKWSQRANDGAGTWLLSVSTPDGEPLVDGVTVVSDRLLLRRYKADPRMPAGDLVAVELTKTIPAPSYTDLGTVVELWYLERADFAAAGFP